MFPFFNIRSVIYKDWRLQISVRWVLLHCVFAQLSQPKNTSRLFQCIWTSVYKRHHKDDIKYDKSFIFVNHLMSVVICTQNQYPNGSEWIIWPSFLIPMTFVDFLFWHGCVCVKLSVIECELPLHVSGYCYSHLSSVISSVAIIIGNREILIQSITAILAT